MATTSNDFNIDPNVWYQISNDRFAPSDNSLRVGDSHTAIYMFATNLTSPQQRWQIFPVADGGGWNFRAQITGSGAYMSQCTQLTSTTASTDASIDTIDVCMALGAATDIQRRWVLSSNGDGTFDIKLNSTNPLYQDYHLSDNSTNTVAFTNDTSEIGVKWAFQSIKLIDDPAFSTGIATVSTTAGVTSTSGSATSSATGSDSPSQTQTSPSSASATSSSSTSALASSSSGGLSTGASAGIGIAVAVLVLAVASAVGFWFLRRRRRQPKAAAYEGGYPAGSGRDGGFAKEPYYDTPHKGAALAELHQQSIQELDLASPRPPVAELPTDSGRRV